MLRNVSYNDKKIIQQINAEVGIPFTLTERLHLCGIGSPKLYITSTCMTFHNLLILDHNDNTCNIEMRPRGIIVRFRSILETFAWSIPYYKLVLYKGNAEEYSIYKDDDFIKVKTDKKVHEFMIKLLNYRADNMPTHVGDL